VDSSNPAREPIFNVPGAVLALLVLLIAMHVAQFAMSDDARTWMIFAMAFIPSRFIDGTIEWPGAPWASITSWITHMVVHADITHLGMNSASLLAFGGAVAKRIGNGRFLLFSLLCGVAGAAAFLLVNPGLDAPMIGASGAISGLMAAATLLLCSALDQGGLRTLRDRPQSTALMPLHAALRDQRILLATASFVFLNILAIFGIGGVEAAGGIAWEAHIGGYMAGLLCFSLFDVAVRYDNNRQPSPD
jgi:membrane associated rhomboid family serine protease